MLNKDILEKSSTLTPICCKYCEHYTTYIIWDMELHLFETHDIRSDRIIRNVIAEGKILGARLDENSIQKLDLEYSKYLDKEKISIDIDRKQISPSIPTTNDIIPWSQAKFFNFVPIVSIDEFFKDDYNKPYTPLPSHPLEQSPCLSSAPNPQESISSIIAKSVTQNSR